MAELTSAARAWDAITWLEMFIRFNVSTKTLPPVPVYRAKQRTFVAAVCDTGRMQHVDMWGFASTFQEAVETLKRDRDTHLFLASRTRQVANLRALGLKWDLPRLSIRPLFQPCDDTSRILCSICEDGPIHLLVQCSRVNHYSRLGHALSSMSAVALARSFSHGGRDRTWRCGVAFVAGPWSPHATEKAYL